MNHRSERSAAFELRRHPSIPVGYGGDWALEVDLIHLTGTRVGVSVVPEETSFLDDHSDYSIRGSDRRDICKYVGVVLETKPSRGLLKVSMPFSTSTNVLILYTTIDEHG